MRTHKPRGGQYFSAFFSFKGILVLLAALSVISMRAECEREATCKVDCNYEIPDAEDPDGNFVAGAETGVTIKWKGTNSDTVCWPQTAMMIPNHWDTVRAVSTDTLGNPLSVGGKLIVWVSSALAAAAAEEDLPSGPDFYWAGFETDTCFSESDVDPGDSIVFEQHYYVDCAPLPMPDSAFFWYGERTPVPSRGVVFQLNTESCQVLLAVDLTFFVAVGHDTYVQVDWATASEIDNAGFNLHRGLSKERPSAQLNEGLIPAQGDELQGATYSFIDSSVTNDVIYFYWLEDVDLHGNSTMHGPVSATPTSVEEREEAPIPTVFSLAQNYPNPFNSTTAISYQLSGVGPYRTTLKVYNLLGQLVRSLVEKEQVPGYYSVVWDGRDGLGTEISSGIYFYRLQAGSYTEIRKMVLLK